MEKVLLGLRLGLVTLGPARCSESAGAGEKSSGRRARGEGKRRRGKRRGEEEETEEKKRKEEKREKEEMRREKDPPETASKKGHLKAEKVMLCRNAAQGRDPSTAVTLFNAWKNLIVRMCS
ncbi:hypothetical protein MHYP_G00213140 [Metynnis hypsauchen]